MSDHVISTEDMVAIARSDDRHRLQELLDAGMDPERTDEFMITPLGVAARDGALACVRLLIERGAALDAGDPGPVNAAIEAGHLHVLEELLKAGAESGGPEDYDPDYPTPLVVAAEVGNVEAIEALVAADSLMRSPWAIIDDAFREGLDLRGKKRFPVLRALTLGLRELGREIPYDASTLSRALKQLSRAAKNRGDGLLKNAIVELRGRLDEAKAEQGEAEDAHLESRFDDLFELIERTPSGRRPGILGVVAASSTCGAYCFSQWLLEKGAAANLCDETGQTALMHAAAHGSHQIVEPLLRTGHACLDARDDAGRTARDLLMSRPTFPSAHLIERDLTRLSFIRRDHATPPLRISEAPSVAQRGWQLVRGRQIPEFLNFLRADGLEEAEWKVAAGAAVLADSANDCMTVLEYCLDEGADLDARIDRGATVLHGSCEVDHIPVALLRRLVDSGADPLVVDRFGRSVADVVRLTWPENHECRVYMESVIAEATARAG